MVYMVTWIPSIYPLDVSINIPAPAGSVMGIELCTATCPLNARVPARFLSPKAQRIPCRRQGRQGRQGRAPG